MRRRPTSVSLSCHSNKKSNTSNFDAHAGQRSEEPRFSEDFIEANETVRNSSCRYESSLPDVQKITAIFVLVRGELTQVTGRFSVTLFGPPVGGGVEMRGSGGQSEKLKTAKSYYILTGAG